MRADLSAIGRESDPERLFSGLIHLETKLKEIEKQRSQIPDVDQDLDRELSEISGDINSTIINMRSKNTSQVQASLDGYFSKIETYLSRINYLPQINSVYDTDVYKEAVRIIEFFEKKKKKERTKRLDDMIQSRMAKVEMVAKS